MQPQTAKWKAVVCDRFKLEPNIYMQSQVAFSWGFRWYAGQQVIVFFLMGTYGQHDDAIPKTRDGRR